MQDAASKFQAASINGLALLVLDEQAMVVLGIDDAAERKVILGEIQLLRQAPEVRVWSRIYCRKKMWVGGGGGGGMTMHFHLTRYVLHSYSL